MTFSRGKVQDLLVSTSRILVQHKVAKTFQVCPIFIDFPRLSLSWRGRTPSFRGLPSEAYRRDVLLHFHFLNEQERNWVLGVHVVLMLNWWRENVPRHPANCWHQFCGTVSDERSRSVNSRKPCNLTFAQLPRLQPGEHKEYGRSLASQEDTALPFLSVFWLSLTTHAPDGPAQV